MTAHRYKSKQDPWLYVPITVIMLGTFVLFVSIRETFWFGMLLILPLGIFIAWMFLNTDYTIEAGTLKIRSGFLYNKKIDISTIRKIKETRNPWSSPATSLDRLELIYNKYDMVLISPKDKHSFISEMTSINPAIEVVYSKKKS